jgi:hypothetical protein
VETWSHDVGALEALRPPAEPELTTPIDNTLDEIVRSFPRCRLLWAGVGNPASIFVYMRADSKWIVAEMFHLENLTGYLMRHA